MKKVITISLLLLVISSISLKATYVKTTLSNHWTFVETYGANGTDSYDDLQAIQNALNSAFNVSLSAGKVYYISSTLIVPANKSFQIPAGSQLIYRGNGGTALVLSLYMHSIANQAVKCKQCGFLRYKSFHPNISRYTLSV